MVERGTRGGPAFAWRRSEADPMKPPALPFPPFQPFWAKPKMNRSARGEDGKGG